MITPVSQEFRVNTYTTESQVVPAIAVDPDGDFVIVWNSYEQDGSGFGIYAQRYSSNGMPQGSEFLVNTATLGGQERPKIGIDTNGNFIITWMNYNDQDGSGHGIFAQRYNSNGIPQGSEFRVNTSTTNNQDSPAIAVNANGDFVIAWDSGQNGVEEDIYAQRYNSSGIPQGSEFRVNTFTSGRDQDAEIAAAANGDFAIAWESSELDSFTNVDVYAQRYNSVGILQGSEFRVNTYTSGTQYRPAIAFAANGDFAIAWSSLTGQSGGIYAQRYNSLGIPQGSEFLVNNLGGDPTIDFAANGDFAIAWNGGGIFAQFYNHDGSPQGSKFQVNTITDGDQQSPAIDLAANGDFVITWEGGTSGFDIYARRYTNSNPSGLNIVGTDVSESLEGNEFADTIAGAGGNDTISGRDGNDSITGDRGSDVIAGNAGNDTVRGGQDNDTVDGGIGYDHVFGGQGNDLLNGDEADDSIFGGGGNDSANGGSGNDLLGGGLDNDQLDGNSGDDSIFGGRGNDSLFGGENEDILNGISPLSDNQGQGEIDTLAGGLFKDVFVLASASRNYYDDGNNNSTGLGDYALITDLNFAGTLDSLQLRNSVKYVVSNAPSSLGSTGAGLFIDTDKSGNFSPNDELIAVFLNVTQTDIINAPKILV